MTIGAASPGGPGGEPGTAFAAGSRLGRYVLLEQIGRGGMGEVWKAEDSALKRVVAVKALPRDFVETPERLARFEQEGRIAASVSHPNLAAVYDVGETGGLPYLVQEYVDGPTLEDLVREGPVAPAAAAAWAIQAAEGLAAVHAAGFLHRDVKPANLVVGRDGRLRVLDFGLATIQQRAASVARRPALTQDGLVLGTAEYMSPEQATGDPLSGATDVWSLGVVLYELLAGRRPFEGRTPVDTLHAVLHDEPKALSETSPEVPPALVRVVAKAMAKRAEERTQTMEALAAELEGLLPSLGPIPPDALKAVRGSRAGSTTSVPGAPSRSLSFQPPVPAWRRALPWGAAAVAVALGAAAWLFRPAPARKPQSLPPPAQLTSSAGLDVFPSFSPDGSSIAYSSDREGSFEVWVRPLSPGGRELKLTSDGMSNLQPAFSPDGRLVAYHSSGRGGIWVVASLGGTPRQVSPFGSRPAWSPDGGKLVFESGSVVDLSASSLGALAPSVLWIADLAGGAPRRLTEPGRPEGGHGAPAFCPDGRRVAFSSYDRRTAEIWTVDVDGGGLAKVAAGPGLRLDPVWLPDGRTLLFALAGTRAAYGLWRVRAPSGSAPGTPEEVAAFPFGVARHLAVSRDGHRLAYAGMTIASNLWKVRVDAATGEPAGEPEPLTRETGRVSRPVLSPDGRKIAFSKWRIGSALDIWTVNADGTEAAQRTTDPTDDDWPSWIDGGRSIGFASIRSGHLALYALDLSTGRETLVAEPGPAADAPRFSPDGKAYCFHAARGGTTNVWVGAVDRVGPGERAGGVASAGGGGGTGAAAPRQVTSEKELAAFACWSPDGGRLAYEVKRGSDTQVSVSPASGGGQTVLTEGPGQRWPHTFSPDGKRIAFAGLLEGFWNVYHVDVATRRVMKVTRHAKLNAYVRYPAFSPSGDLLVYEFAETTGNLWMVDGLP